MRAYFHPRERWLRLQVPAVADHRLLPIGKAGLIGPARPRQGRRADEGRQEYSPASLSRQARSFWRPISMVTVRSLPSRKTVRDTDLPGSNAAIRRERSFGSRIG